MSNPAISPIQDIIADIRAGKMVILVDDEDRENEGDLIIAADYVTPEAINFMAKYGRGLICLTLTRERCQQLPHADDSRPDAKLRRPLKDVKELPEREPEERADHRDRMQHRNERVGVPLHPRVAHREHQTGDADRQKEDEGEDILAKLLYGGRSVIDHAPPKREHHPRDHQEGRPHETVKDHERHEGVDREFSARHTEDEGPIALDVAGHGLEVDPSPDEGKRDRGGDEAAPHDEPVGGPAGSTPPEDEVIERKDADDALGPGGEVGEEPVTREEHLPAAPPEERRRRALQPHGVAVRNPKHGKQRGECVANERRVEVGEVAGADGDQRRHQERRHNTSCTCADRFSTQGWHRHLAS